MKQLYKLALVTTFAVTAMASSDAASVSVPEFRSFHKPLNVDMASEQTMKSYEKDVVNYVNAMDKVIKELVEKRNSVIRNYNEGVHEYNKDDFFHRGSKLKPIKMNESHHHAPMVTKEKRRENVQTLKASTTDTWTDSDNVEETLTTLLNPDTTRKTTHKHSSSISSSKTKSEEKTKNVVLL